jgi:ArsR family transcriptional regulator
VVKACCAPRGHEVLSSADAETLSRQFAALAGRVRLQFVSLLANAAGGAMCACDLVEPVGKSQPTVSYHIKVLAEAGHVTSERRGRNVWYGVVPAAFEVPRPALAANRRSDSQFRERPVPRGARRATHTLNSCDFS